MAGGLPPGVIQITKGDGPPQNDGARPPIPPPAPVPPQGMPQGGGRPQFPQAALPQPGPAGMPPTAVHAMRAIPNHFPPPPPNVVPRDLQRPRTFETVDIRSERLTEAEAREQLSDYVVIRMEKASKANEVDEEGYPARQTWEKANHIEQTEISRMEATRKVRELERTTESVVDKKGSLSPAIQRQLEKAMERLILHERDQRYTYILSQLESQTRKIDLTTTQYVSKSKKGKTYTETKKSKPKRKLERVAVTAYFKRTPRPGEDALGMVREKERAPLKAPPTQIAPPPFMPIHPMNPGQNAQPAAPFKPAKTANVQVVNPEKKAPKGPASPRESQSSWDSDYWTESESDMTPSSSLDTSSQASRRAKHRSRSRHRLRDRPENYGLEAPRNHDRPGQRYLLDANPPPAPPPRESMMPPRRYTDDDVGRIWNNAYLEGRNAEAAARPRAIEAPPPRIIQHVPSVRRISIMDARREIEAEELDRQEEMFRRMQLDEDIRRERDIQYEKELEFAQREEELMRGRRMSCRFSRDRLDEAPWPPERGRYWEEREAQEYMDRDRPLEVEPFGPYRRQSYRTYQR